MGISTFPADRQTSVGFEYALAPMASRCRPAEMIGAAQYIRMSTENQRYSPGNQKAAIEAYAAQRGYEVVKTYEDLGVSGLKLTHRTGLQQLLADVVGGQADFDVVLTYDVSRWGRFQNPDQSAHYEFICKEAGVSVEYCAEEFDNDGSMSSAILKLMKRVMAAEYSRDLSAKVLKAQLRLAGQGVKMGGVPGYGLRRCLLDSQGNRVKVLREGEVNAIRGNRTILIPGPLNERAVVRRIYREYLRGVSKREIVRRLIHEGVAYKRGRTWGVQAITRILTEDKYAGDLVFNRRSQRIGLKKTPQNNPRDQWIVAPNNITPLVDRATFAAVQEKLPKSPRRSRSDMLAALSDLLKRKGRLNSKLINCDRSTPSTCSFERHFGSVTAAYAAIGYIGNRMQRRVSREELLDNLRALLVQKGRLSDALVRNNPNMPSMTLYRGEFGSLSKACEIIGYEEYPRRSLEDFECLQKLSSLLEREGRLTTSIINNAPDVPCAEVFTKRFGSLRKAYRLVGYEFPLALKSRSMTDQECLQTLVELFERHGRLSTRILAQAGTPSRTTYVGRFGSLRAAFKLAGYESNGSNGRWRVSDDIFLQKMRELLQRKGRLSTDILDAASDVPSAASYIRRFGSLTAAYKLIGYDWKSRPSLTQARPVAEVEASSK